MILNQKTRKTKTVNKNRRHRARLATPIAEVEAIANRALLEALVVSANTLNVDVSKSMLETSRLLKMRAEEREREFKKLKGWRLWLYQWLGMDQLMTDSVGDLHFLAGRFKFSGDVLKKYNPGYHIALMEGKALALLDLGEKMKTAQDKRDMEDAALSIRQFAALFIDNKGNITNNDNSE